MQGLHGADAEAFVGPEHVADAEDQRVEGPGVAVGLAGDGLSHSGSSGPSSLNVRQPLIMALREFCRDMNSARMIM